MGEVMRSHQPQRCFCIDVKDMFWQDDDDDDEVSQQCLINDAFTAH